MNIEKIAVSFEEEAILKQAFAEWNSGKAYDKNGKFKIKDDNSHIHIAQWNSLALRVYGSCVSFMRAADYWAETGTVFIPYVLNYYNLRLIKRPCNLYELVFWARTTTTGKNIGDPIEITGVAFNLTIDGLKKAVGAHPIFDQDDTIKFFSDKSRKQSV